MMIYYYRYLLQKKQNLFFMGNEINFTDQKLIGNQHPQRLKSNLLTSITHRSIGALIFKKSVPKKITQKGIGSAVALARNLLLTSAHNLFDKVQQQEYSDFQFYLCPNGVVGQCYQIEAWIIPKQYRTCLNNQSRLEFDYALVKLKKDLPYAQFPSIGAPCQSCLIKNKTDQLQIYGYSFNNDQSSQLTLYQLGLQEKEKIVEIQPSKFSITYAISTESGFSGCPLIVKGRIIGLHTGSLNSSQNNIGRFLTCDMIANLIKWAKELKGDSFPISTLSCLEVNQNKQDSLERKNRQIFLKVNELQHNLQLEKNRSQKMKEVYQQKLRQCQESLAQLRNSRMSQFSNRNSLESQGGSNRSIISHHPINSHKQYYKLECKTTAKITHQGQEEGWFNFVNSLQLAPNQVSKFSIKMSKVTDRYLYIGFCTKSGLQNVNSQRNDESAYYYCGGYLWQEGKCKQLKALSQMGDIIECIADLKKFKFAWIKKGLKLAECEIPLPMREKGIYFSLQLLKMNDYVELTVQDS